MVGGEARWLDRYGVFGERRGYTLFTRLVRREEGGWRKVGGGRWDRLLLFIAGQVSLSARCWVDTAPLSGYCSEWTRAGIFFFVITATAHVGVAVRTPPVRHHIASCAGQFPGLGALCSHRDGVKNLPAGQVPSLEPIEFHDVSSGLSHGPSGKRG